MRDDLCAEAGYVSLKKEGETLSGDHVEIFRSSEGLVLVLADGLGTGVRASILSTLTAKILGTMIAGGMPLHECVDAVTRTLPEGGEGAYSTFTVIEIRAAGEARLIQFDNPAVVVLRDGEIWEYPRERREIAGREILESRLKCREGDVFVALSDGAVNVGGARWRAEETAALIKGLHRPGISAKGLACSAAEVVGGLCGGLLSDDATVAAVRLRARSMAAVAFGPPADPAQDAAMMNLFLGKAGKKIVCGGTTAMVAARRLGTGVVPLEGAPGDPVPPMSEIRGVDLVTEGVLTFARALEYAERAPGGQELPRDVFAGGDGAARLARALVETATDIHFLVGRGGAAATAVLREHLVRSMAACLERMGKRVVISWF